LFLLLGHKRSLLCNELAAALKRRGYAARILDDLFGRRARVVWTFDSERAFSECFFSDNSQLCERNISGVLVTKSALGLNEASTHGNRTYVDAEKRAALLGWISNLGCPVINRYQPDCWFEPPESLDFCIGKLEAVGLEPANSVDQTKAPGESNPRRGEQPILESNPPGDASVRIYPIALVGSRVIWDHHASGQLRRIDEALVKFAESLGLSYFECWIDNSTGKPRVAKVQLFPIYDDFSPSSREEIINELATLLTNKSAGKAEGRTGSDSWF
jgi:hypothetical protein